MLINIAIKVVVVVVMKPIVDHTTVVVEVHLLTLADPLMVAEVVEVIGEK